MNTIWKTLAAAAMGAVGVLTLVNVASAQEATTETPAAETPAAETPAAETPADGTVAGDENCPEKDGADGGSSSDSDTTGGTGVGFFRL